MKFTGRVDGKGGFIIPEKAVRTLKNTTTIDGVQYPFVWYGGEKYVVIETPQGWTIGGEVANEQHARNVAALQHPRLTRMRRKLATA